nr:Chain B, deubiquitinating enzyme UBPY [synthetic construct]
TPMVNRENKPP